jgi:hypothetical protein
LKLFCKDKYLYLRNDEIMRIFLKNITKISYC